MSCTIQDIIESRYANQMGTLRSMGVPDGQLIALFCPQIAHDLKRSEYIDDSAPPVVVVSTGVSEVTEDPYESVIVAPSGEVSLQVPQEGMPPGYLGVNVQDDPDAYTSKSIIGYVPEPGEGRVGLRMAMIPVVVTYVTTNWSWISAALQAAGVFITVDAALELLGGTGLTNVDDIVQSILNVYFETGDAPGSASGKLHAAPGWKAKQCTKYVRRQAKQYDAMYKPMKTFTNAEKNAYSMGHRVASVWWSKALRRSKRRSYRAGKRKMQQQMMMYGYGKGSPMVMVDT